MKRIFTLLIALGTIAAVQAQGNRNDRDFGDDRTKVIVKDNDGFDKDFRGFRNDDRFAPDRKIAWEVAQINREYDYKIQMVRNNFFMSRFAKMRKIQQLEDQRQWEIKMVYRKYRYGGRGHDRDHF